MNMMSEELRKENHPVAERGRAEFLTTGLAIGLWQLLHLSELLPTVEALLAGFLVAYAIGYWLPPKPKENYFRWMLDFGIFIVGFYLAFFKIPALLKRWMGSVVAYGIPIFIFFVLYTLSILKARRSATKGKPNNSFNPTPR